MFGVTHGSRLDTQEPDAPPPRSASVLMMLLLNFLTPLPPRSPFGPATPDYAREPRDGGD